MYKEGDREREGVREGGRQREGGRDTLMHSCTYSHPACMCLDQIQSAAREKHRELHQCPAEGEVEGRGKGLSLMSSTDIPLDADELRRRRLLRFER